MLRVKLSNGVDVEAKESEWVRAIIMYLAPQVLDQVAKMVETNRLRPTIIRAQHLPGGNGQVL